MGNCLKKQRIKAFPYSILHSFSRKMLLAAPKVSVVDPRFFYPFP